MAARLSGLQNWRAEALAHPIFAPYRRALATLLASGEFPDTDSLNTLAVAIDNAPRTACGTPVQFVVPPVDLTGYELHIHATGCVPTRPDNLHDLFNALVWLTFPEFKAQLNARHADAIPREDGRRGRLRDLLTLLDEGGALVACADPDLAGLVRAHRWRELFAVERTRVLRGMRIAVIGHAILEQALAPWPGLTCKALFVEVTPGEIGGPESELFRTLDARGAAWLRELPDSATPRVLPPLPIFGFPGWYPGSDDPAFYEDPRYFRPLHPGAPAGDNATARPATR